MRPIILTQFVKERGEKAEKLFLINPENIGTVIHDTDFWEAGEIPLINVNNEDRSGFLMTTRNGQKFVVKESLAEIKAICDANDAGGDQPLLVSLVPLPAPAPGSTGDVQPVFAPEIVVQPSVHPYDAPKA